MRDDLAAYLDGMDNDETLDAILNRREKAIRANIRILRAELKKVKAARSAASSIDVPDVVPTKRWSPKSGKGGEPTIKEYIVNVLDKANKPLDALAILEWINASCDKNYARESLSPQLSRLGKGGIISREGKHWSLTELGQRLIRENRMRLVPLEQDPAEAGSVQDSPEGDTSSDETDEDHHDLI